MNGLEAEIRRLLKEVVVEVLREELPRALAALAVERSDADDAFMSVAQAARQIQVHPSTIRKLISSGRLATFGDGRLIRIRRSDLEACLRRNTPSSNVLDFDALASAVRSRRSR